MRKSSIVCDGCGNAGAIAFPVGTEPEGWTHFHLMRTPGPRAPLEPPRFRLRPDAEKPGELIASVEAPKRNLRPLSQHQRANIDLCSACTQSLEIRIAGKVLELVENDEAGIYAEGWG